MMMIEKISICIDMKCPQRLECKKFIRALDYNGGKIKGDYKIIEKCEYER